LAFLLRTRFGSCPMLPVGARRGSGIRTLSRGSVLAVPVLGNGLPARLLGSGLRGTRHGRDRVRRRLTLMLGRLGGHRGRRPGILVPALALAALAGPGILAVRVLVRLRGHVQTPTVAVITG